MACPHGPGRLDELHPLDGEDGGPHETGESGDGCYSHGDHQVEQPRPEHRGDDDGQKDRRDGELHVHDPHDDVVDPSSEVSGDGSRGPSEDEGYGDGHEAHLEGYPRSEDQPAQDIPAELVGAEEMLRRGSLPDHGVVLVGIAVGGYLVCEYGHDNQDDKDE